MTEPLCVCGCGRPVPDQAYAATACANRTGDLLHDLADMAVAARDVATGLARRGLSGSQGAQDRIPLNLGATERLNRVQAELAGWARHVAETRGIEPPKPPPSQPPILGPLCRSRVGCLHESCRPIRDPGPPPVDITAMAARFLSGHVEWWRHRPECDAFMRDIETCHRIVRSIARGPNEQKFLGPCGALIIEPTDPALTCDCGHDGHDAMFHLKPCPVANTDWRHPCDGDVYAYRGAKTGRCKTCGATVDTSEREAWLDGEVRGHAFTARQIADAHFAGTRVNVKTIRTWAARGQLKTYWRTSAGIVADWTDPPLDPDLKGDERKAREQEIADELEARGPRLHYVGDVLDLAAAEAGRRATEQAKRARRVAEREAEQQAKHGVAR